MKNNYEKPSAEVICFVSTDIMTGSEGIVLPDDEW